MKVIGYRRVNFTPKDGDRVVSGVSLYVTEAADNVVGVSCDRLFVDDRRCADYLPKVGDEIEVSFNKYGKVQSVYLK